MMRRAIRPCGLLALLLALTCSRFVAAQEPTERNPDPRLPASSDAASQEPKLQPPEERSASAPDRGEDDRSVVLVERVCESTLERQEVTLFANGTVRVRRSGPDADGREGEPDMALGELPPDELAAWTDRIREEDLSETDARSSGPGGDWVERCSLSLDYDAMERWVGPPPRLDRDHSAWHPSGQATYRWGHLDSLSLPLSRLSGLVDAIAARVDLATGRHSLPPDYRPRAGDVLRRADGILFRVERHTATKGGWELQGVEQPLVIYIIEDEIPKLFVELVRRH